MSQQYQDMYQDYSSNRSPSSSRAYNGLTLQRQPSRHFESFAQAQGLYTAEDHAAQYDSAPRFERMPSATLQSNYPYDSQTWNYGGTNGGHTMGGSGTGRIKPQQSRRPQIPTPWLEPQMPPMQPGLGMINHMNGQYNSQSHLQNARISPPPDSDELIPTAIVIKNIPFAVKKEQLMQLMSDMGLPLPYAFNYHFDNGVFRGLAFANFSHSEETSRVIEAMNHMDLQGRKLRVEYKKMLPAAERDRIEREKRERRGQLQEQHQPMATGQLQNQASMSSINSGIPATSPSPVSMRSENKPAVEPWLSGGFSSLLKQSDVDLNNPRTLGFYTELVAFKLNHDQNTLVFPVDISPEERKEIHTIAHYMGLYHKSEGRKELRQAKIFKSKPKDSPPSSQLSLGYYNESQRRGLNRAATIDFSEARGSDPGYYHTLGRQGSGLLDIPGSPGLTGMNAQNLRAAKSFADLRSYTPSPVPSSASFPANLTQNISRYTTEYGLASATSGTPNLTPTSAGGSQMNIREEAFLLNGLGNMAIGYDRPSASRTNGRLGQTDRDTHGSNAGPIGSQRPTNGTSNYEESSRNGTSAVPERQPRGPGDWSTGFPRPRQNGHVNRGSGELDLNSVESVWDDNRAQDSSDRNVQPASTSRFM